MNLFLVSAIHIFKQLIECADQPVEYEKQYEYQLTQITKMKYPDYLKDACKKLAEVRKYHAKQVTQFSDENFYRQITLNFIEVIDNLIFSLDKEHVEFDLPFANTLRSINMPQNLYNASLFLASNRSSSHFTFIMFIRFYLCSDQVLNFAKLALESVKKNSIHLFIKRINNFDPYRFKNDFLLCNDVYNNIWAILLALAVDKNFLCNFIWKDEIYDPLYEDLINIIFYKHRHITEDGEPHSCFFSFKNLSHDKNGTLTLSKDITVSNLKLVVISDRISDKTLPLIEPKIEAFIYNSRYYMKKAIMYTTSAMNQRENTKLIRFDGSNWKTIEDPKYSEDLKTTSGLFFAVMFERIE